MVLQDDGAHAGGFCLAGDIVGINGAWRTVRRLVDVNVHRAFQGDVLRGGRRDEQECKEREFSHSVS